MSSWPAIKRFLRNPAVILGEIAAIAVAGALGAMFPQCHVFQSVWFAAVTLLAAASLTIVVHEQFRRLCLQWRQSPVPSQFSSAPFKTEFERPASGANLRREIWTERRLGLAGSLVFHAGLLLLFIAGAWRALFATEAAVDLLEGETLAPAAAWSAQWPGIFAQPLRLDQPLTLQAVNGRRYPGGDLRELRARFSAGDIAVNQQLQFGGSRLYLAQEFGPAALLEWNSARREAILLADNGRGNFSGESVAFEGVKIFLHSTSERPASLEVRVMRGNVLLAAGTLAIGGKLTLPGGEILTLRGAPMWARLHGSRDSALWLAYAGMILTMAGAAMMFCLIKLDLCVIVTPLGEREKVLVALKPQRFAPLFQERFDQLVLQQRDLGLRQPSAAGTALSVGPAVSEGERVARALEKRGRASLAPAVQDALARTIILAFFGACLTFTSGCNRVSQTEARQLVERYNQIVSEAYRRGDVRLIDPVVGPNEGKKLAGLIGVRLDLGITLDSQLLALEVTGVAQAKDSLEVRTKEKWSYRDLKIGTGEQVGQASEDFYEMTYNFTNANKAWVVDEIKFAAPPQVGRTNTPWIADPKDLHAVAMQEARP